MHAYRRFLVHFVFSNVFHEVESVVFDTAPASVDVVHHLVVLETTLCKKQQHLVSLVSDSLARTSHSHTVCQTHCAVSIRCICFCLSWNGQCLVSLRECLWEVSAYTYKSPSHPITRRYLRPEVTVHNTTQSCVRA